MSIQRLTVVKSQSSAEYGPTLPESVREGLSKPEGCKSLSCVFFYDERGSELFEEITGLDEYYLTRCERQILEKWAPSVAEICGKNCVVVELGSGSSEKTKILLESFMQAHGTTEYVPIDISAEFLEKSSMELLRLYVEKLLITAVPGLYQEGLQYVKKSKKFEGRGKLVCFFGSSIGNFNREEAKKFLREVGDSLGPQDRLLIGIDLKKGTSVLEAAYNDSLGVTAEFNMNLLQRINKELGARFNLAQFHHRAVWNEKEGRIEMRLYSDADQVVRISDLDMDVTLKKGEFIHTENCHKYSHEEIAELADSSGFAIEHKWLDEGSKFSLSLFSKKSPQQS